MLYAAAGARERCPKVAVKGWFLGRVRLVGCVFAVAYAHTLAAKGALLLREDALNGPCTRARSLVYLFLAATNRLGAQSNMHMHKTVNAHTALAFIQIPTEHKT